MKLRPLLFLAFLLLFLACSDKEMLSPNIEDCASLIDAKILSEAERENSCSYLSVHVYQSAIYTTCVCCVCNKISIATSCEGVPLCDFTENCMEDFYKNAVYLYSVSEN